jgi:hypothetical protein
MKMTLWIVCAGLMVACVLAGLGALRQQRALRAEVARLRTTVEDLRRAPAEVRDPAVRRGAREDLPMLAAPLAAERLPAERSVTPESPRLPPSQEAVTSFLRTSFENQPVDAHWAAATGAILDRMIRSHLKDGSALRELSCRSSLCRLVLTHPDARAQQAFMDSTLGSWPGGWSLLDRQAVPAGGLQVTIVAAGAGANVPVLQ